METNCTGGRKRLNKVLLAALVVCSAFLILCIGANALRKDIEVSTNGTVQSYKTYKATVGEFLTEKNIGLEPEDVLSPGDDTKLKDDMTIVIKRAVPVILVDGSVRKEVKTAEDTVGDLLSAKGIVLRDKDRITPGLNDKLKAHSKIKITRVDEKTLTAPKQLPYDVTKRNNGNMKKGKTKVVRQGEKGQAEVIYKVTYEDGKPKSKVAMTERVIKQPLSKIVEVGSLVAVNTSRGDNVRYTKQLNMVATAYDASYKSTGKKPGDRGYGITCTGARVRDGIAAVDPKVIPLGTKLYIEGYGYALAADTGGAIRGNRIDIFCSDFNKVNRFGMKKVKVYLLKN